MRELLFRLVHMVFLSFCTVLGLVGGAKEEAVLEIKPASVLQVARKIGDEICGAREGVAR